MNGVRPAPSVFIRRFLGVPPAVLLSACVFLGRCLYSLNGVGYAKLLVSDMAHYWNRAMQWYSGDFFNPAQWSMQSPMHHILLAKYFHVLSIVELFDQRHEMTLILYSALAAGASYLIYRIVLLLTESEGWALASAALYGFSYPLMYMNALIMSENVAGPLLIAANFVVFRDPRSLRSVVLSAVLLGLAIVVRPAFILFQLVFAAYVFWMNRKSGRAASLLRAGVFLAICVAWIASVSAHNAYLSKGQVKGLAGNSGVTFYMRKCKVRQYMYTDPNGKQSSFFDSMHMEDNPWDKSRWPLVASFEHPLNDDKYFYAQGMACIENDPSILWEQVLELRYFFIGHLYPEEAERLSGTERVFARIFTVLLIFTAIPFFLGFPVLAAVSPRFRDPRLFFFWGLLAATAAMGLLIASDRRYLLPLYYAVYAGFLSVAILLGQRAGIRQTAAEAAWKPRVTSALWVALIFLFAASAFYGGRWIKPRIQSKETRYFTPTFEKGQLYHLSFDKLDTRPARRNAAYIVGARESDGKYGPGLRLDGRGDYVSLGTRGDDFTKGFTIAFWACPERIGSWARFVDFGNNAEEFILFSNMGMTRDVQFQVWNTEVEKRVVAPGAISLYEWQHFAGVLYPDGKAVIYKNGKPCANGVLDLPKSLSRSKSYLGKSNVDRDDYYCGKLDEFYMIGMPLDEKQIQAIMENKLDELSLKLPKKIGRKKASSEPEKKQEKKPNA